MDGSSTEDLTRFMNLKTLAMYIFDIKAQDIPNRLKDIVSGLNNPHLEDIKIELVAFRFPSESMDLSTFAQCDDILSSRPRFQSLTQLSVKLNLELREKDLSLSFEQYPSVAASHAIAMLIGPTSQVEYPPDDSKPQNDDADDNVNDADDNNNDDNDSETFRTLVQDGVKSKIEAEFRQLSRGVLKLEVQLRIKRSYRGLQFNRTPRKKIDI